MAEQALDIPIENLPFDAGKGFSGIVKDGVAHIVIHSLPQKKKVPAKKKSLGDWARKNRGIFKGVEKHANEAPLLEAILEKHAPGLLD